MAAREEDKAMAGLLRRSLAQDAGAGRGIGPGENCLEPEILAAYFDHALDAEETARYDLHFSRCSVCREQLAAMARAGGVGDGDTTEKKNAAAWAWLMGPGWLMPAAAMLVALLAISGIALRMRKPVVPANEIAMSRPDAVPPSMPSGSDASRELGAPSPSRVGEGAHTATRGVGSSQVGASGGVGAKPAAAQATQPQAQKPAQRTSPDMVRRAMRTGNAGNGSGASRGEASGSGVRGTGGTANSADATAAVMEAAPPLDAAEPSKVLPAKKAETNPDSNKSEVRPPVDAETAPQPTARKTRSSATTSVAGATGAAAPAQSAKAMNLAASKATGAAELAKMQQAQISSNLLNLQIQTPDAKILWMIAGADAIEKSQDGGATWKLEYPETRARIIAGSAPSVKICWLVGENGTILRTTNGARWKKIGPPAETDFVRVEATDALTATVTALDGRRFATSDGGKSWRSVK